MTMKSNQSIYAFWTPTMGPAAEVGVPQMVKNLPVMQETWIRSLGWEDPLWEGMTTHSSIIHGHSFLYFFLVLIIIVIV